MHGATVKICTTCFIHSETLNFTPAGNLLVLIRFSNQGSVICIHGINRLVLILNICASFEAKLNLVYYSNELPA